MHFHTMKFILSDYDAKVVNDVVYAYRGRPLSEVILMLTCILQDIGPAHYIAVGLAIGELLATEEMQAHTNQISQTWQSQN